MRGRRLFTTVPMGLLLAGFLMTSALATVSATQDTTQPSACDRAIALVEEGKLRDAETLATAVGASCADNIEGIVLEARAASDALMRQAEREADEKERQRLAELALTLDSGNGEAKTLLEGEAVEQKDLCKAADAAVTAGLFARAEALYTALEGNESAKECRQDGLVDLAAARSDTWPQRISDAVTKDGLLQLLLGVIAFGLGVTLAVWSRWPARLRVRRGGVAGLVPLALIAHIGYFMQAGTSGTDLVWLVLVLLLTLGAGAALATLGRDRAPIRIEASTEGDEPHDATAVARQTLIQLHRLSSGPSAGLYAIDGTDLHDTGVRGVLGALDHPWLNALLKVWDTVVLKSGDRVVLTTTGSTASLAMYEGRRLVRTSVVDPASLGIDQTGAVEDAAKGAAQDAAKDAGEDKKTEATEGRGQSDVRDLAIVLAADILWWRLEDPKAETRLYGARNPNGLALATIAGDRLADGDLAGARRLAARAAHVDPGNRAAALAGINADLRGDLSEAVEDLRLSQLEELLELEQQPSENRDSPLKWRLRYTLATGLVNRAVRRDNRLRKDEWQADFGQALQHWAHFLTADQRAALPQAAQSSIADVRAATIPEHPDEKGLWDYLSRASLSAAVSVALALSTPPDTSALDVWSLTGSRTDHQNLACGYATAYHLTPKSDRKERRRLAEQCVARIRLAASEPRYRELVLADPFLSWVKRSKPYAKLLEEWELSDGPYAGIQAFGSLVAQVTVDYPKPADLLTTLRSWPSRERLRTKYQVDGTALREWEGAAEWLIAGRKPSIIDRYQRAGFRDRASVTRTSELVVSARLAASAKLDGVKPPSEKEQAKMRTAASTT